MYFYCTSDGLQKKVPPKHYSDPVDDEGNAVPEAMRYAIRPCGAGYQCIGYNCAVVDEMTGGCVEFTEGSGEQIACVPGSFSAAESINCTLAARGKYSDDPTGEQDCPPVCVDSTCLLVRAVRCS